MGHMATHGKAMDFGLRKRSDRWGVLEKGLVQAEIPVRASDGMLIRIVEYNVKKLVKSKNTVLLDVGTPSTDKWNESLSPQLAEASTTSVLDRVVPISRDFTGATTRDHPRTNLAGSMLSIITTSSNDNPERHGHNPAREIISDEVEDKKNLRLLLYRSMRATEDYSTLVGRALSNAKVDLQLGITESSVELGGVGCVSARGLIHSARKDSARGYSRGTDSSRAISVSIAAAAALLLSTTIHVKCTTKDVEEPSSLDSKNILSSEFHEIKKIPSAIEYDSNGRVCIPLSSEDRIFSSRKGGKDKLTDNKMGGFSSLYEEGGSVTDLFNSLIKSFVIHLPPDTPGIDMISKKNDIDEAKIYDQFTLKVTSTSSSNVQHKVREVNLVIDITGKWLQEAVSDVTKIGTGTGTGTGTFSDNHDNKKILRTEARSISQDLHDSNSDGEAGAGAEAVSPTISARSAGISASDPEDHLLPIQQPIMSIRKLLRTAREFSTAEKGESYLYSHKIKMIEKERANRIATDERNKLDFQTAVFTAKRRKIILQFTVTCTDDIQALSEKVFLQLIVCRRGSYCDYLL